MQAFKVQVAVEKLKGVKDYNDCKLAMEAPMEAYLNRDLHEGLRDYKVETATDAQKQIKDNSDKSKLLF